MQTCVVFYDRCSYTFLQVAQFSGYVSEHSDYHHGEQSLVSTIIGMAQNYVGSNNINLLAPLGQFGTRSQVTFPLEKIGFPFVSAKFKI